MATSSTPTGPDATARTRRRAPVVVGAVLVGALAAASWMFWSRSLEIEAPPPAARDDIVDSLTPIRKSIVDAEIRYDLDSALFAIEKAVPRRFGDIEQRHQMGDNKRAHFAFAAQRSPFVISVDGRKVTISSVVEYEGRGWYRPPIGPTISAACGTGEVPKPRARVRVESTLRLTEGWTLASNSRVTRALPFSEDARDQCKVTIFRIDVTERVMKATQEQLQRQLFLVDRAMARVNTRDHFEKWWRSMSRPIRLTDSIYFTINPTAVELGPIDVDSGFATAHLRLEAEPRIVTGNRPNDFDLFTPLPPLRTRKLMGDGLRVSLEGEFGYDVANALLRKQLVGKTIQQGKYRLNIRDISLAGIGGGQVALGVRVDGSVRGRFFLTGTPAYDNSQDQLYVPDLAFDLQTEDLLVKSLAWLRDDWIRDFRRERARFPVEGQLDRLRRLAEQGMNRRLAEGVELVATVERAENVKVRATRRALVVRADAAGRARLDINKPLKLKRMASPPAPKTVAGKSKSKAPAKDEGSAPVVARP